MKRSILVWLALAAFSLAACRPAGPGETPTPDRQASDTPTVQLQASSTATSMASPTDTPAPPTLTPASLPTQTATLRVPTPGPLPTGMPTLKPAMLPDLLRSSLNPVTEAGIGGRLQTRVTGWGPGFRSPGYCADGPYRWLDPTHLMLYPIVGSEEGMGITEWTRPAVLDLASGRLQLPPTDGYDGFCDLPVWSGPLGLVISTQGGEVIASGLDGEVTARFAAPGPLSLAPSGRRLLAGSTWIDLDTREQVRFASFWQFKPALFLPGWSADERRIFVCCFEYADAGTGRDQDLNLEGLEQLGRGVSPGFPGIGSHWVRDDNRVMVAWDFAEFGGAGFGVVPLIDPVTGQYQDLRALAGLSLDVPCGIPTFSPATGHAWLPCTGSSFLVDLNTYTATRFETLSQQVAWSWDGRFFSIALSETDERVISLADGGSRSLDGPPAHALAWSPATDALAYLTRDPSRLLVLDAGTGASRQLDLPGAGEQLAWGPAGDTLAVLGADGSVWWIPEAADPSAVAVAAAAPGAHDLRFSPDGRRLAWVHGGDLFVVELGEAP